jgi:hypothetical protein
MDLYIHCPNTPSWRGAQLKHRGNFTFTWLLCLSGYVQTVKWTLQLDIHWTDHKNDVGDDNLTWLKAATQPVFTQNLVDLRIDLTASCEWTSLGGGCPSSLYVSGLGVGCSDFCSGLTRLKRLLERTRCWCEDSIKMSIILIGCKGVEWINLAQDRYQVSCQHGSEYLGWIKRGESLGNLRHY